MFQWQKLGKIFEPADLPPGSSWMQEYAQSPATLIDAQRLRVYFSSRPAPDQAGQYVSRLAYVDLDPHDPRRLVGVCQQPALALGGFGTFDEFGTNPVSVVRDGSQVRVYYAGWTRCESVPFNAAIGVAISEDGGDSFQRVGDGPVLSYSPDEPYLLGSPRIRRFGGRWYLWYVAGRAWLRTDTRPEPVYKIRMAVSADGFNWTKVGRDLIEDRLGINECQACADVVERDGRFHMFYSFREALNYKSAVGGYRMGYAVSDDLLNWQRQDERLGMSPSAEGWDSQMVSYPHVFELAGQTYMLYQGNDMGRTGFGLARLDETAAGSWA